MRKANLAGREEKRRQPRHRDRGARMGVGEEKRGIGDNKSSKGKE